MSAGTTSVSGVNVATTFEGRRQRQPRNNKRKKQNEEGKRRIEAEGAEETRISLDLCSVEL